MRVRHISTGASASNYKFRFKASEEIERTSSNSEMYALCEGLDQASGLTRTVVIHTDSAYVWDFVHKLRHQFRLTGYQNAENPSLLRVIDAKLRKIEETNSIYVVKVKAHCGNQYNEMADWLASKQLKDKTFHYHPSVSDKTYRNLRTIKLLGKEIQLKK